MAEWDWGLVRAQCLREAQGVLGQSGGAEDAAQEAAVRAWRRQDSCLTPERPQPWVATIARNEALRIAAQCPWTRTGCVEVRPLEDMEAVRQRVNAAESLSLA